MQMLSVILRHVHVTILETNTLANEWNFEAIVYVTMLSELNFCLYTKKLVSHSSLIRCGVELPS